MKNPIGIFPSSKLIAIAFLLLVVVCCIHSSVADVVWVDGQAKPLYGQIISNTPEQIDLQVFENGKLGRIEKISRSRIEQFISNIDTQRLEKLSPDKPADYRDYAEELASQRADPAARQLAHRLYVIAAANSEGDNETANEIRNSALAGLISIADSDADRARLQLLRFLVSPDVDQVETFSESKSAAPYSEDQAQLMLKLVQAIRKENFEQAVEMLSSRDKQAVFQIWSKTCSLEELNRIARVNRPSKPQLSKLLRIELQILSSADPLTGETPSTLPSGRRQSWGDFATQGTGFLSVVPSFENVTSIDPRNSVFRSGRWVKPGIKSGN